MKLSINIHCEVQNVCKLKTVKKKMYSIIKQLNIIKVMLVTNNIIV